MSIVGEVVPVGRQGAYGNSVLSTQFCFEPKTALKSLFKKKKEESSVSEDIYEVSWVSSVLYTAV